MIEKSSDVAGIQPHDLLFALLGGDFLVGQVSANAGRLIGREPRDLLGTRWSMFRMNDGGPSVCAPAFLLPRLR